MPEAPLIIRGGQSVAPDEVERILRSHPAVAEAAVVGLPDPFWDEIVAAAVRLSAPLPSAADDLTEYCRERLDPYKIPARWLFTGALPRTGASAVCRPTLTAQLTVASGCNGSRWSAELSAGRPGGGTAPDLSLARLRPRPAIEDLLVPRQVRRCWALEDLD